MLTPSIDAGRRVVKYFPSARVRLAPHTDVPPGAQLPEPTPYAIASHAHLRILVVGAVGELKGADTLEATAIEAAQHESPLEFHLVGYAHRALCHRDQVGLLCTDILSKVTGNGVCW